MGSAVKHSTPDTQHSSNATLPGKNNQFTIMESLFSGLPFSIIAASTESGLNNLKVMNEKIREQLLSATDTSLTMQESAINNAKKLFATYEASSVQALKATSNGLENATVLADAIFSKANDSIQSFAKKQMSE